MVETQIKTPDSPVKKDNPVEAKDARFRRLAMRRVPAAVKRLEQIANLGNRTQYAYTEEQVGKIMTLLRSAVERVENAFSCKNENGQALIL